MSFRERPRWQAQALHARRRQAAKRQAQRLALLLLVAVVAVLLALGATFITVLLPMLREWLLPRV